VSVWDGTANGRTVTGHAPKADRLLIRPASGRQTGTGLLARTYLAKDTRKQGHSGIESRTKSTGTTLATTPDGVPTHSQCGNVCEDTLRLLRVSAKALASVVDTPDCVL
jgi:hypothetical protein